MDPIEITVQVNQKVSTLVDPDIILDKINDLPSTEKWNYIAHFINGIAVTTDKLTDDQKKVVRKYLESKLKLFL